MGGLVPRTESGVLGGVPFTSAEFCDVCTHGSRMTIDDLSAPSESFVARVSASVAPSIAFPAAGGLCLQLTTLLLRFQPYPPYHGFHSSPGSSIDRRPADSFLKEFHTGDRLRRHHRPDRDRLTVTTSVWPGPPPPPTAKPSSDRISTRTRRRRATAAGNATRAVDHCDGPGGAPRPSARRAKPPPRVPRPRPAPHTAATPAAAASPVPAVRIPSDRDRTEHVGTVSYGLRPLLAARRLHV